MRRVSDLALPLQRCKRWASSCGDCHSSMPRLKPLCQVRRQPRACAAASGTQCRHWRSLRHSRSVRSCSQTALIGSVMRARRTRGHYSIQPGCHAASANPCLATRLRVCRGETQLPHASCSTHHNLLASRHRSTPFICSVFARLCAYLQEKLDVLKRHSGAYLRARDAKDVNPDGGVCRHVERT